MCIRDSNDICIALHAATRGTRPVAVNPVGVARYHVASGVVPGLLKISPDFQTKKIKTQIKKKVQTSKYLRN